MMHSRPATPSATALVPAVSRALTLLDTLAQLRQPMSLTRLATDLDLPKSSVHGLCNTLVSFGYLRRLSDGAFQIGPRVMTLAGAFVAGTDVAQEFNSLWSGLATPPDDTMILSVLNGPDVVYVATREGSRPLGLAFNVGMQLPAHLAATGKAMLAFTDPDVVRRVLPTGPLVRMTRRGPADIDDFINELATTRRRGHSVDDEGVRDGVYCFGAPVFDAAQQPVAGIGLCTSKSRLTPGEAERHVAALTRVAAELTRRLGGEMPAPAKSRTGKVGKGGKADAAATPAPRTPSTRKRAA